MHRENERNNATIGAARFGSQLGMRQAPIKAAPAAPARIPTEVRKTALNACVPVSEDCATAAAATIVTPTNRSPTPRSITTPMNAPWVDTPASYARTPREMSPPMPAGTTCWKKTDSKVAVKAARKVIGCLIDFITTHQRQALKAKATTISPQAVKKSGACALASVANM